MSERIGVLAALVLGLGGTVAAATRFVVADVDPLTLGALRFGGAFLVCCRSCCALRQPWPKGRDWIGVALLGAVVLLRLPGALQYRIRLHDRGARLDGRRDARVHHHGGGGAVRRRATERAQDRRRAGRNRRRRGCARGGPCGRATRRVARRPHHARRHLLLGLLQCLVAPLHRAFVAADLLVRRNGVGAACLLALALWRGGFGAVAAFGPAQWIAVAYMAIFAAPVAFWLWIFALKRATPTRVASTWRCIRSAPRSSRRSSSASRSG